MLKETFERLNTRIFATRYRSNLTDERWDQAVAEHAEMLKRLEARPVATLSIEAQERHEKREKVYRDDAFSRSWAAVHDQHVLFFRF